MNLLTLIGTYLEASAGESFIDSLIDGIETLVPKVGTFFSNLFTAVISLIYTNGNLTIVGWLMLMGLGFGAFWFIFRWLRKLIRFR